MLPVATKASVKPPLLPSSLPASGLIGGINLGGGREGLEDGGCFSPDHGVPLTRNKASQNLTPACSFWDRDSKISSLFGASPPGPGNSAASTATHGHPAPPRCGPQLVSHAPRLSWETHLTPCGSWPHGAAFWPSCTTGPASTDSGQCRRFRNLRGWNRGALRQGRSRDCPQNQGREDKPRRPRGEPCRARFCTTSLLEEKQRPGGPAPPFCGGHSGRGRGQWRRARAPSAQTLGPREAPLQDGDLDLVTPGRDAEQKRQTRENDSSGPRGRRPPSPASLQRLEEDDRRHSHTRPTRKRSGPGGRAAGKGPPGVCVRPCECASEVVQPQRRSASDHAHRLVLA